MLLEIAITLIMAKLLNFLFEKFKQPGVVGEIIAGIILGPCCLGYFSGSSINIFGTELFKLNLNLSSIQFKELAYIGIVFLMFILGMETNTRDLKKAGRSGFFVAFFSTIVPFLLGFLLGYIYHFNLIMSMAIGAIFYASSITISMRILSDIGLLSTRVGSTLQTAGIFSDIIGIFIFSLLVGQGHPLVFILKILIFLIFIIVTGFFVIKYAVKKGVSRQTNMIILPFCFIICFLFAAFAEDMGLAAIIGAFAAGLIISKTPQVGLISNYIKTIGYTFFIPLFFVWVGASFNLYSFFSSNQILSQVFFVTGFVILCLFGNFIGGSIGAKISGLSKKESTSVGIGMMPIMGMGLVIVTATTEKGIFGDPTGVLALQIKSATLLLIIVSCLITPSLLKRNLNTTVFKKSKKIDIKSFIHSIPDTLIKRAYPGDINGFYLKKNRFFIKLFIAIIIFQFFFIITELRYADKYYVGIAAFYCFIGSLLGYLTLKYILTKQKKNELDDHLNKENKC